MNLYAADAALGALRDFVATNRAWPASERELLAQSSFRGVFVMPRDADDVFDRAQINFKISLCEIYEAGEAAEIIYVSRPVPEVALATRLSMFSRFIEKVILNEPLTNLNERDVRIE